ncbi:esterase/lipase family protein [Piscinibacter sakaiensis]|uniref:Uncharacterized protein n=1 Tax=Piscinibacter sakaiensis TaxID=1547922 RepID=A0A0K8P7L4_PISS1|nr:hypothetical protein [Piscinibacter sakaiensis]GAP38622.1 hypothetical protein ISF6_5175 [Piscinibacter sakaiensis]
MELPWNEVDKLLSGLATDVPHEAKVRREAIPLVFVPGIMGSRLRLAGTDGSGENAQGLPNLRWEPSAGWLFKNCSGEPPEHRKALLIGEVFDPGYLEVDEAKPVGDGFRGIMEEYRSFLEILRTRDWGPLARLFEFPVYACGYNWTGDAAVAGARVAKRIDEIMAEARQVTGRCEKVILISHSMGGLVTRAAAKLAGAEGKVLGIVHGVQPAWGAAAAYWRIKAGFEGSWIVGRLTSRFLGSSAPHVTIILGNAIGGLELLPTKQYVINDGRKQWLFIVDGKKVTAMPRSGNPYDEIYRVKGQCAKPKSGAPSTNTWWGLVDPALLDPARGSGGGNALDDLLGGAFDPWGNYLGLLATAEGFHASLGTYTHPYTYSFHGRGEKTAEFIRFDCESNWVWSDPYRTRGFLGFYRNEKGEDMQAVLQDPGGDGDGTVPVSSATFQGGPPLPDRGAPGHRGFDGLEHQPAFESGEAQRFTIAGITALVARRYAELRG